MPSPESHPSSLNTKTTATVSATSKDSSTPNHTNSTSQSRRLQELCEATDKDPSSRLLAKTVHEGWPKTIKDCPHSIQSYWHFRDQITCKDGLYTKGPDK